MSLPSRLSVLTLALAAALPLTAVTTAHAQPVTAVMADSFAVEAVRALTPGTELDFRLTATPGADVTLQIAGATGTLRMDEVRSGVYEGTYTVRSRDRMTAASLVTARLQKDGRVMNATLDQSLVRGAPSPVPASRIGAFTVNAPDRPRAGDELKFSLAGVTGGSARVTVQGLAESIPLTEVSRGLYEGSHTLRRQERLRGDLVATGYLKVNQHETSRRFERKASEASTAYGCNRRDVRDVRDVRDGRQWRDTSRDTNRAENAAFECGDVTAVNKVEVDDGDPRNLLGTIAGGVIGGVIGNQVGGGSGQDIARIVGAIGGAYAGNRIQNTKSTATVYRVTVQLDDGAIKNFDHAADPVLAVGARVKIADGAIVLR